MKYLSKRQKKNQIGYVPIALENATVLDALDIQDFLNLWPYTAL